MFLKNTIITTLLMTGALCAAENYATWTYNTNITLNTSSSGANVLLEQHDFPVLIRLSSSNFIFSEARGQGQDIRFRKANGAHLNYQIERWDSAGSAAEIWVKVDTLLGNTDGQIVNMLWGNPLADDSSSGKAVFDTANGFTGVWHLNETGSVTAQQYKDATARASHGTGIGMNANSRVLGAIGFAQNFDGILSSIALPPLTSKKARFFTVSAWVLADSYSLPPVGDTVFYHSLWSNNSWLPGNVRFQFAQNQLGFSLSGNLPQDQEAGQVIQPAVWNYFSCVYNGNTKQTNFYINGELIATKTYTTAGDINLADTSHIGTLQTWYQFKGIIDELEISSTNRSGGWIKLAHANQKANQNLVTVALPIRCKASFPSQKDTTVNEGAYLALNSNAKCASQIIWSVVSGPAPRILDPEANYLPVNVPRIVKDTFIVYSVTAVFPDSSPSRTIRINIKETTPDPIFTLPILSQWNGNNPLDYLPTITNLAAIAASPSPTIHWVWSFSGVSVDTTTINGGIRLSKPEEGQLEVKLCLDNGGLPACKSNTLTVTNPVALKRSVATRTMVHKPSSLVDAQGRRPSPNSGSRSTASPAQSPSRLFILPN